VDLIQLSNYLLYCLYQHKIKKIIIRGAENK